MDTTNLTIDKAKRLLGEKQVSAEELAHSYIEKAKTLGKKLNVFITVSEEKALEQAKRIDNLISDNQPLPKLAGVPIAVKDNYLTSGIKTTAASKVLENFMPVYSATVVNKLEEEGAIFIGKTNMDAWAHGGSGENSDFGNTLNPYDQTRVPGGSSSGSGAAVAADLSVVATGSDTGGSIRTPAAFCNVVGLKPTYGRVSRYGVVAMASSLDAMGHLTKTVFDNAYVLGITSGLDKFDATTSGTAVPDYTDGIGHGVKGLKIGLPKEYFEGLDSKIKDQIMSAAKKLEELGAKIVDVSLPHTQYGVATYYIIQPSEVSSNLARYDGIRYGNDRDSFGSEAKRRIILGTYTLSSGYYDAYYLKAMKVRRLIRQDFLDAFEKVDCLLCPVSPTVPFKLGEKASDPLQMYLSDIYTVNANLAGVPSLAVPAGFVENLSVGLQLIGPDFSEKLLYQIAYAYEQETKWYERVPEL